MKPEIERRVVEGRGGGGGGRAVGGEVTVGGRPGFGITNRTTMRAGGRGGRGGRGVDFVGDLRAALRRAGQVTQRLGARVVNG